MVGTLTVAIVSCTLSTLRKHACLTVRSAVKTCKCESSHVRANPAHGIAELLLSLWVFDGCVVFVVVRWLCVGALRLPDTG